MDWLTSFRLGKVPLADALFFYLTETGAHHDLLDAYAKALSDYQEGNYSDLAEGFGIAMSQRQKSKMQKSIEYAAIKELVEELARGERVAQVDSTTGALIDEVTKGPLPKRAAVMDGSVYMEAGNRVGKSGETVRDICRNKKKNPMGEK